MRYLYFISFLLLMGLISSCIKNPVHFDIFPIKANPGKFECYVNGKDYVPDSNRFSLTGGPVSVYLNNGVNDAQQVIIYANIKGHGIREDQMVRLQAQNVSGPGVYEFNEPNRQYAQYATFPIMNQASVDQQLQPTFYNDHTPGHGNLTITRLDAKNKIVAGTFWFNAISNNNLADSVKVTGGHFNIKYN